MTDETSAGTTEVVRTAADAAAAVERAREVQMEKLAHDIAEKASSTAVRVVEDAAAKAESVVQKADAVAAALIKATVSNDDRITKSISDALRDVFNENVDTTRFIDTTRIPLICQNINGIFARLSNIEDNLKWGVRIVIGAVILALLALLIK